MKKNIAVLLAASMILLSALTAVGCSPAGPVTETSGTIKADTADISAGTSSDDTDTPETAAPDSSAPEIKETEVSSMLRNDEPVRLKVASYNIQHAAQGIDKIVDTLKQADADIVGVQEVDYLTSRVNGQNQPKLIADGAGYPYYKFIRAIDYKGGQYGTLILSKYPIVSCETVKLDAGDKEGRSFGHAVIDVNGITVDFFNTHLSFELLSLRAGQFAVLAEAASKCGRYLVTGDFNTADYTEFSGFTGAGMINRTARHYVTFPGNSSGIDNILFKGGFTEISSGTVVNASSDHYMMWAIFTLDPMQP